jgi:hypothetical protein
MSRIQSIACSNFAGRHPVPSVALSNKSDHRPLFRRSAHRQLSLQCGTNFRVCGSVRDEANRDQIAQNLFRGLSLWHWASALGMSLQPSIYRSRRAFLPVSKEGRNQCPLLGVKRTLSAGVIIPSKIRCLTAKRAGPNSARCPERCRRKRYLVGYLIQPFARRAQIG